MFNNPFDRGISTMIGFDRRPIVDVPGHVVKDFKETILVEPKYGEHLIPDVNTKVYKTPKYRLWKFGNKSKMFYNPFLNLYYGQYQEVFSHSTVFSEGFTADTSFGESF